MKIYKIAKNGLILWHGTQEVIYEDGQHEDGDETAISELKNLAQKHGIKSYADVANVFEKWINMGMAEQMGITEEDAKRARILNEQASGHSERGTEKIGFNEFLFPENSLELGVHFGTKEQAEAMGTAFPFLVAINNPLRLPDLGTWHYQSVMREARRAGVDISEAEYDFVFNARNNNQALRELLLEKGIDGIVYKNEAEGKGDSYIAFDSSQIEFL